MLTTSKDKNIWFFNLLLLGVILFKNADVYQDYVFGKSLIIRGIGILGLMLFWYSYFKLPKISLGQLCRNPLLVMFIFIGFVTILRFDSNSDFTLYRKMMMGSYIWPYLGSVVILGGLSLVNSLHAYTFASLKRKKLISTTPLNDALNALILALNASAAAFVLLFTKKFRILS